jgi:hypothetical protein
MRKYSGVNLALTLGVIFLSRRRRAYIEMPVVCLLLALTALTLSGLLRANFLSLAIALTAVSNALVHYLSKHQKKKERPLAVDPVAVA